jgi:hypothetical protein
MRLAVVLLCSVAGLFLVAGRRIQLAIALIGRGTYPAILQCEVVDALYTSHRTVYLLPVTTHPSQPSSSLTRGPQADGLVFTVRRLV